VLFRQLLNDETACASYILGCATHGRPAVVDPQVDECVAVAEAQGIPIVAILADPTSHLHEISQIAGSHQKSSVTGPQ
jgi:hypothetical protein